MARETIVLTRGDLLGKIDFARVIPVIEECLAAHEKGQDLMPPKLILELPGGIAACLSAYTPAQHALTMKNGQERKGNRDRGLPSIHVHVHLFDPETGELLMICEGLVPTHMRTAAAAAVAARHLALPEITAAAIIGAGQLGRQGALAAVAVREVETLYVVDTHPPTLAALIEYLRDEHGLNAVAAEPEEAIRQSRMVFTCSNSTEPIIRSEWVQPGTHLSCMGADLHTKMECEPALIPRCKLYADNYEQCVTRGEVSQAIASGLVPEQPFVGRLGEVINGAVEGRASDDEITLFDGTGLGVQDTAMAAVIYQIAQEGNLGARIDWTA